jgi:hypothetical protein
MSSTAVLRSCFWWSPFLRTVAASADFKRFCIDDDVKAYVEYIRRTAIGKEKGHFYYAVDETTKGLQAVAVASVRANVLYVHFYWASSYRRIERPLVKIIFDVARKDFFSTSITHVMFPVPIESIGVWDGYGARVHDDFKRRIVWYKFPIKDFSAFAQYITTDQAQLFVA